MGSILIIEGHPILREALRRFLFPEHQTATWERWAGAEGLQRYDLVIVDRETVEQGGSTTTEVLRALQRIRIPSVWLHQGPAPSLRPGRLTAMVAKPLEGPVLEAAVRSLLETGSEAKAEARPSPGQPRAAADIIELTEVVEESGSGEPDSKNED